jgi:hypothetical protein
VCVWASGSPGSKSLQLKGQPELSIRVSFEASQLPWRRATIVLLAFTCDVWNFQGIPPFLSFSRLACSDWGPWLWPGVFREDHVRQKQQANSCWRSYSNAWLSHKLIVVSYNSLLCFFQLGNDIVLFSSTFPVAEIVKTCILDKKLGYLLLWLWCWAT